jgi:hypothetical protein
MKDKLRLLSVSNLTVLVKQTTYTPKYAIRRESFSISTLCMIEPGVARAIRKADSLE